MQRTALFFGFVALVAAQDAPQEEVVCAANEYVLRSGPRANECQQVTECNQNSEKEIEAPTKYSNRKCLQTAGQIGQAALRKHITEGRHPNAPAIGLATLDFCFDLKGSKACRYQAQNKPGFCDKADSKAACKRTCNMCDCFDGPAFVDNVNKVVSTIDCIAKKASWPGMCSGKNGKAYNSWAASCPYTCGSCANGADKFGCVDADSNCASKKASWPSMCTVQGGRWRAKCQKTCGAC